MLLCDCEQDPACAITTLDISGNRIGLRGVEQLSTALPVRCFFIWLHYYIGFHLFSFFSQLNRTLTRLRLSGMIDAACERSLAAALNVCDSKFQMFHHSCVVLLQQNYYCTVELEGLEGGKKLFCKASLQYSNRASVFLMGVGEGGKTTMAKALNKYWHSKYDPVEDVCYRSQV